MPTKNAINFYVLNNAFCHVLQFLNLRLTTSYVYKHDDDDDDDTQRLARRLSVVRRTITADIDKCLTKLFRSNVINYCRFYFN